MKNLTYLILTISLFTSCIRKEPKVYTNILETTRAEYDNDKSSLRSLNYSNPAIIYGISFGEFFLTLNRLGKYEEMLKFTSKETVNKFGRDKILEAYQNINVSPKIKLVSITDDGNYKILHYTGIMMATRHIIKMKVIVENDSTKIVLEKLKLF